MQLAVAFLRVHKSACEVTFVVTVAFILDEGAPIELLEFAPG